MMTFYRTKSSGFTDSGFSLMELLIVLSIIGILAAITGLQMSVWLGKARVEEQTKKMYADIVSARMRAMNRNRMHFVSLDTAQNRYLIWEDTDPGPDGNGALTAADTKVQEALLKDQLYSTATVTVFNFDSKGIISPQGLIRIENTHGSVNDCIAVTATRIRIGRYDGSNCSQ